MFLQIHFRKLSVICRMMTLSPISLSKWLSCSFIVFVLVLTVVWLTIFCSQTISQSHNFKQSVHSISSLFYNIWYVVGPRLQLQLSRVPKWIHPQILYTQNHLRGSLTVPHTIMCYSSFFPRFLFILSHNFTPGRDNGTTAKSTSSKYFSAVKTSPSGDTFITLKNIENEGTTLHALIISRQADVSICR